MTQSDACSAYTQWFIGGGRGKGVPTWVTLPRHRWPKAWEGKYKNPVVLLILALYGHPDAGAYWEQRCESVMASKGWSKTCWKSMFWHKATMSLMIIYVDDFRMVATPKHTPRLWGELRQVLLLDDPEPPGRFLGCYQHYFTTTVKNVAFIHSQQQSQSTEKERDSS